jgi:hypothetical protein
MGKITPFRRNAEDDRIMDLIREHLTEVIGDPSETDCLRFALKAAEKELSGKPKPRHPRAHK